MKLIVKSRLKITSHKTLKTILLYNETPEEHSTLMKVLKIKRMNAGEADYNYLLNELISGYFRIIDARRLGNQIRKIVKIWPEKFNIENLLEIFAMRRICRIIYIQH